MLRVAEYVRTGRAWLLVGSGPSIEMGYPTWKQLAKTAIAAVKLYAPDTDMVPLDSALASDDYPLVFGRAKEYLGADTLLPILNAKLVSVSAVSRLYTIIASWPVPVYLTTNYDDALIRVLNALGAAYLSSDNSQTNISSLKTDESSGLVVKLHGDLRSEERLVLTTKDYDAVIHDATWDYWKVKLSAIMAGVPLVVIGHSLRDRNVQHILELARDAVPVDRPVCWIAPEGDRVDRRRYLRDYRIHVVPYSNSDGQHHNLGTLLAHIGRFLPSRSQIRATQRVLKMWEAAETDDTGAAGLFVFNRVLETGDMESARIDVILAALQAALPRLRALDHFTIQRALREAGWPESLQPSDEFQHQLLDAAVQRHILQEASDSLLECAPGAEHIAATQSRQFLQLKARFTESMRLRVKRLDPTIMNSDQIARDIEASLVSFFQLGGLTLASALFSRDIDSGLPTSVLGFLNAAANKYNTSQERLVFSSVATEIFVSPGDAERAYLGRLCHGYFAFYALGVFGDSATARFQMAQSTVWLLDSDVQIQALALAEPTNAAVRRALGHLRGMGIRLFTLTSLFHETWAHLQFASILVHNHGPDAAEVIAGALGEAPYDKSNAFLQGFILWQEAGNRCSWESYMRDIFGVYSPTQEDVKRALEAIGVEIVALDVWPGFTEPDFQEVERIRENIIGRRVELTGPAVESPEPDDWLDITRRRAKPEAEAFLVVRREVEGKYGILSGAGRSSEAYFVSHTSVLNTIEGTQRVTWRPEAFLGYTATLCRPLTEREAVDQSFETILVGVANSGLVLLDDASIGRVFSRVIENAKTSIEYQDLSQVIRLKYGEDPAAVLERVRPRDALTAAVQLANEAVHLAEDALEQAKADTEVLASKLSEKDAELRDANKQLSSVSRYIKKAEAKRLKHRQQSRTVGSKKSKKVKRNKPKQ